MLNGPIVVNAMILVAHKAHDHVEDQWHITSMIRQVTQKNPNPLSIVPFIVGMMHLQVFVQDIDQAAKWVKTREIWSNFALGIFG